MSYKNQELLNRYPEFIHGGKADETDDEFVIHMRYPRYLARCCFAENYSGSLKTVTGELTISGDGKQTYLSNVGIVFKDFFFLDKGKPQDLEVFSKLLLETCNRHAEIILARQNIFELGYTPSNLRTIREAHGLTQSEVAQITGTANYRTVVKWEAHHDSTAQRADMPLKKWLALLAHLKK